jgi:UDP-N-acetylmuramoylalanine--D-glutamate ligase
MHNSQQALVLGLGISGEAAARLLAAEGWRVTVLDAADRPVLQERAARLRALGVAVELGARELPGHDWQLAVPSPGLAEDAPWLVELRRRGVDLIPEFELGWSRFRGRTIAVTGSNGKSSVVKWLAESLQAAGLRAEAVGNIGVPVCESVLRDAPPDWLVIEVSSFQLEQARAFRPGVAVLLNLVPNHLDRHGALERYVAAKLRLFAHAAGTDACIVPLEWRDRLPDFVRGQGVTFGAEPDAQFQYHDACVWRGDRVCADLRGTYFGNPVLGVNAAAAVAALEAAGVDARYAEAAARAFQPLPHRMEEVATWRGIRFINDSKATTLTALSAALAMSGGKVHLIAGGRLKETDLAAAKKMLVEHAVGVYVIGESSERFAQAWRAWIPCTVCGHLTRAVECAANAAQAGHVVLLSPGCASFDQFAGYAERGELFRRLVMEWIGKKES